MPAQRTYSQAKYWILTIPHANFTPYLPNPCAYIKGQLERGESRPDVPGDLSADLPEGFLHWQVLVAFEKKTRLRGVREVFGPFHAEPTRSDAASEYVWKDETSVEGTRFELGKLPMQRGSAVDWDTVRTNAKLGNLEDIPADIYVRNYNSLKRIATDNLEPVGIERRVRVYWGATGTGKSRRAWEEAGLRAYPKDPRTKFWDGYRGHPNVIIDEFRGAIDIAHMLRWLDRYPVIIEVKGASTILCAENIWITSNLHPRDWYRDIDEETKKALLRRLEVTQFHETYGSN
uniref:ATP-dependent helicase Rep n=1 Tax=uncultured prokaryote TaxID=198431 RepID=A0A0H5QN01_9ZZZZ|nr:hypothetical protein [uncultured prokaryote]